MSKLDGSGTAAGSTLIIRSKPPLAPASFPGLPEVTKELIIWRWYLPVLVNVPENENGSVEPEK